MQEEMKKCKNIQCAGVQDVGKGWGSMPVYEMTREPSCDKRKTEG